MVTKSISTNFTLHQLYTVSLSRLICMTIDGTGIHYYSCNRGLLCRLYAHTLLVLDDNDFYERHHMFTLAQQRGIATALNALVFRTYCPASSGKPSYTNQLAVSWHHFSSLSRMQAFGTRWQFVGIQSTVTCMTAVLGCENY